MVKKRTYLGMGIVLILLIILVGSSINGNVVSANSVTMYKSSSCGCCVGHAGYLDGKGYDVKVIADMKKLDEVKSEQKIPMDMRSCHTIFIEGYFIEGHMPIEAIEKLLGEKPEIDGIALPDMPSGSPGMPGVKKKEWIIYAIKDGQSSEFMRI